MTDITTRDGRRVSLALIADDGSVLSVNGRRQLDLFLAFFDLRNNWKIVIQDLLRAGDLFGLLQLARILFLEVCLKKQTTFHRDQAARRTLCRFMNGRSISHVECRTSGVVLKLRYSSYTDLALFREIFILNQYNVNERIIRNKTIIDAGANVGYFSIFCAALGAKKVYAFEPVRATFAILQENVARNGYENIIVPVHKALGSENGRSAIRYTVGGDPTASIGGSVEMHSNTEEVELVRLADFLCDEAVDLIKIDVEGFEEEVLLGAGVTLQRCRPILTFSGYHRPTDKERLPAVVLSFRADYRIRFDDFGAENIYCD